MARPLIVSDPDILSGTPVFCGTRVPVKNLTDCLEAGDTIDRFLDSYPSVTREQATAFLESRCRPGSVKRFFNGILGTIFLNLRMYKLAERFDPLRGEGKRPFPYIR